MSLRAGSGLGDKKDQEKELQAGTTLSLCLKGIP